VATGQATPTFLLILQDEVVTDCVARELEELRLLYVAMTRARRTLKLTFVSSRDSKLTRFIGRARAVPPRAVAGLPGGGRRRGASPEQDAAEGGGATPPVDTVHLTVPRLVGQAGASGSWKRTCRSGSLSPGSCRAAEERQSI
jgi:hypothetical protein